MTASTSIKITFYNMNKNATRIVNSRILIVPVTDEDTEWNAAKDALFSEMGGHINIVGGCHESVSLADAKELGWMA